MPADWYYHTNDKQYGPVSFHDMHRLVRTGFVTRETPVWTDGWDNWYPASNVPGLFQGPPPIPFHPTSSPAPTQTPEPAPITESEHGPRQAPGFAYSPWITKLAALFLGTGIYAALHKNAERGSTLIIVGVVLFIINVVIGAPTKK